MLCVKDFRFQTLSHENRVQVDRVSRGNTYILDDLYVILRISASTISSTYRTISSSIRHVLASFKFEIRTAYLAKLNGQVFHHRFSFQNTYSSSQHLWKYVAHVWLSAKMRKKICSLGDVRVVSINSRILRTYVLIVEERRNYDKTLGNHFKISPLIRAGRSSCKKCPASPTSTLVAFVVRSMYQRILSPVISGPSSQ